MFFVFFCKQKTAYEMRISDWSSDVCSSDLFMPITATLAVVAGAAMAGVPLLNGFLSKEMFFAETLAARRGLLMDVVPVGLAIAASAFGVIYSLRFVRCVFFGPVSTRLPRQPRSEERRRGKECVSTVSFRWV